MISCSISALKLNKWLNISYYIAQNCNSNVWHTGSGRLNVSFIAATLTQWWTREKREFDEAVKSTVWSIQKINCGNKRRAGAEHLFYIYTDLWKPPTFTSLSAPFLSPQPTPPHTISRSEVHLLSASLPWHFTPPTHIRMLPPHHSLLPLHYVIMIIAHRGLRKLNFPFCSGSFIPPVSLCAAPLTPHNPLQACSLLLGHLIK